MDRATRWLLGIPQPPATTDGHLLPTDAVAIEPQARQWLTRQVQVLGKWQGGALFGTFQQGTLRVSMVTTLGPPGWTGSPLTPSMPYLIGATQSAAFTVSDAIDWAGQWIAAPDGRLPNTRDDHLWLMVGARQGRFDGQHPLVVLGLQDGYLAGRAYVWDDGEAVAVSCPLGPLNS